MNLEILTKLESICQLLDELPLMKQIQDVRDRIFLDHDLLEKIDCLKENPSDDTLRKAIFKHPLYASYKKLENELYYLILQMNQKLKTLTDGKECTL